MSWANLDTAIAAGALACHGVQDNYFSPAFQPV